MNLKEWGLFLAILAVLALVAHLEERDYEAELKFKRENVFKHGK